MKTKTYTINENLEIKKEDKKTNYIVVANYGEKYEIKNLGVFPKLEDARMAMIEDFVDKLDKKFLVRFIYNGMTNEHNTVFYFADGWNESGIDEMSAYMDCEHNVEDLDCTWKIFEINV